MKSKFKLILAVIFAAATLLFVYSFKNYDVAAIGPCGTEIGLSHVNAAVHEFFGVHLFWYYLTNVFGIIAIGICVIFGFMGLVQWIQRKNMFKVDGKILALGVLYSITMGMYFGFEKIIVNYRPILMPDCTEPEASFPSSHTMLIIVVFLSLIIMMRDYIKNATVRKALTVVCITVSLVSFVARLICGVHWFTDIISALLISTTLLFAFSFACDNIKKE